jgi:hypothetical protein
MELKKYSGVEFYLDLLKDVYWRSSALEVLSKWLEQQPDRQRVEFILNANINKLFTLFKTTKEDMQFSNLLVPTHSDTATPTRPVSVLTPISLSGLVPSVLCLVLCVCGSLSCSCHSTGF